MKGGGDSVKKKTVWSWNFTVITLGTLISAIGGAGITLGLSLVVFDQTQSTLLSGLYTAISMIPGITLPVLFGPLVDKANRKHIIGYAEWSDLFVIHGIYQQDGFFIWRLFVVQSCHRMYLASV